MAVITLKNSRLETFTVSHLLSDLLDLSRRRKVFAGIFKD
jgi:hypothetical protein